MEQDKIWDAYQNDPGLQAIGCRDGGRLAAIANLIPNGSSILDIGVGRGTLEHLLSKRDVKVHCLDPSATSISRLRESLGLDDRAKVGYSQEIPFQSASFDFVVMSEVLEHLSDEVLDRTRSEVSRVLVDGGIFMGTVPADETLNANMVVCPNCSMLFHRWGHAQSFSKDRLKKYLAVGFRSSRVARKSFVDWKSLNWKGKVSAVAKVAQSRMGIKGTNQNFLFIAVK